MDAVIEIKNINDDVGSGEGQLMLSLAALLSLGKDDKIHGALIHPCSIKAYEVKKVIQSVSKESLQQGSLEFDTQVECMESTIKDLLKIVYNIISK